ncbi:MAG: hypothetical protein R2822_09010 [Spirosomataceae bacterium]
MKVKWIGLLLWCFLAQTAQAFPPDTVWKKVERRMLITHDEELTFYDKKKRLATLKIFDKSGILLTETNFKDYEAGVRQGFSKGFYPDGQLYWVADYRNNELWGDFKVYYEDGTLKRRELYWSGVRKEKHCFNQEGEEIPYYEFSNTPQFPGGEYALQSYLRSKLRNIHVGSQTEMYGFDLTIQADSIAVLQRFGQGKLITMAQLEAIVRDMPKWIPARIDDVQFEDTYRVNLTFRAGMVYLSNLALDFAGAYRKQVKSQSIPSDPIPFPTYRRRN